MSEYFHKTDIRTVPYLNLASVSFKSFTIILRPNYKQTNNGPNNAKANKQTNKQTNKKMRSLCTTKTDLVSCRDALFLNFFAMKKEKVFVKNWLLSTLI